MQNTNNLSSILYLNELYKIKVIIYNNETDKYYTTTMKNYNPIYCKYVNNSWTLFNQEKDIMLENDLQKLDGIINLDIDTILIHTPFLSPISKYKMNDLETIAKNENISMIHSNGKKKLKKDIYDEINLKHYIQDI